MNIIKQMFTGIDNQTFDPARVIGYGAAIVGIFVFVFNSLWVVIHGASFDAQSYGVGLCGVLSGVFAVGAGVSIKAKTEPT